MFALPVEIEIPRVDAEGQEIANERISASELKIATMRESLNSSDQLDIDLDTDRFYFKMPKISDETVQIKWATLNADGSYYDGPTLLDLMPSQDGSYLVSEALMLVSDDIDDDYSANGVGSDDQDNDRTHKAVLGGNVKIESLIIDGNEISIDFQKPVQIKGTLDVEVVIVKRSGAAVISGGGSLRSLIKGSDAQCCNVIL